MKKQTKQSIYLILYIIFLTCSIWVAVSTTIQRFKCAELTETELFQLVPQSFICNWKTCN